MVIEINKDNFEDAVLKSDLPFMLDIYTKWCGPCRAIVPFIEQMATDYAGKANIGKLDAEENSDIALQFEIRSVPTFLFFKGGELVDKQNGAMKDGLTQKLNALL